MAGRRIAVSLDGGITYQEVDEVHFRVIRQNDDSKSILFVGRLNGEGVSTQDDPYSDWQQVNFEDI
jgi:hypothetical protein